MKKAGMIIAIIICILLLPGCQRVPEKVKESVSASRSNYDNQTKLNHNLQYDTIDNIFKTINEVTKGSYSNLSFSHDIKINKPAEIGQMEFSVISNFDDNYEEINKNLIGADFDKKYLARTAPIYDPPGYTYDDKEKSIYLGIGNNGFYYYYNDVTSTNYIWNSTLPVIKKIILQSNYKDCSYPLKDGDMKVSEAVGLVKSYLKDKIQKYSTDIDLLPYDAIVYQDDKGNYLYNIECINSYKNLYFTYLFDRFDKLKKSYTFVVFTDFIIASSKSGPTALDNPAIFKFKKIRKNYDKIITFECATKIVEKLLSSYTNYSVQFVNLETRFFQKGKRTGLGMYPAGNVFKTRPCWVFYLDVTHGKEIVAMVDCETGETEFINNAGN